MHNINRRQLVTGIAAGITSGCLPMMASAQAWPARPITLVVTYPPGGGIDPVARILAQEFGKRLGQSVVVDNRSGASGTIGTGHVARAAADGYTLLLAAPGPLITSKFLIKNLPYDPIRDFDFITKVAETPICVFARQDFPGSDIRSLKAFATASPGKLNMGTIGEGSTFHVLQLMMAAQMDTSFTIVPFRGSGQLITEMLAGRVDASVDYLTPNLPHLAEKKLKILATLGSKRLQLLPDVPTIVEAGYPTLQATSWLALAVPKGTPSEVQTRLSQVTNEVMAVSEVKSRLAGLSYTPALLDAKAFTRFLTSEQERFGRIIHDAKLSVN
jgi:tripartite-type tricarboxylate transporter receptor subunit TctC